MNRRNFLSFSTSSVAIALGAGSSVIKVNFCHGGDMERESAKMLNPNTKWLREAKWGVFTHYLPHTPGEEIPGHMTGKMWNKKVNSFKVSELGDQLEALNAPYFFITLGQKADYYCSPNSSFEKLFGPSKGTLTERDLVAELAADLIPRGIRMCVYLPALGHGDSVEMQAMYQQVITEWSERWGESISAWWIDEGVFPSPEMYKAYTNAFKAGNKDALIAYNNNKVVLGRRQATSAADPGDYYAGQRTWSLPVSSVRPFDKLKFYMPENQLHFLTFTGTSWGTGNPRFPDNLLIGWVKHTNNYRGTISLDVPLTDSGIIPEKHFRQMTVLSKKINNKTH